MDIEKIKSVASDAVLEVLRPESKQPSFLFADAISKAVAAAFEEYDKQEH